MTELNLKNELSELQELLKEKNIIKIIEYLAFKHGYYIQYVSFYGTKGDIFYKSDIKLLENKVLSIIYVSSSYSSLTEALEDSINKVLTKLL